ncbi:hypothetical protein Ddye_010098 [Dipteronia dyeriana]|uniref:HAT C-terminal dimerisation domain-containing protein n=1 Tax=Dipteronia dyeriana TaxID=168575 RepID=A0AAD9XCK7_9ROSI|nr:hypothetical protein Ddye_010098 [Dipteronia dyeriana]
MTLPDRTSRSRAKCKFCHKDYAISRNGTGHLRRYLEAQFDVVEDKKEFDLLLWWKTYTYRYSVLSHLARDVLVIPVSTVSSEQAFSTSGRIIEPRRSCLSPEMVEARQTRHADRPGTACLREAGVPCLASVFGNGSGLVQYAQRCMPDQARPVSKNGPGQTVPNGSGHSIFTHLGHSLL